MPLRRSYKPIPAALPMVLLAVVLAMFGGLLPLPGAAADASSRAGGSVPDLSQVREIARDAYVYAYPLVLMDVARQVQTNVMAVDELTGGGAPANQFTHMRRAADALLHGVPYPDLDTLWSALWFDVSKEPLLIEVPDPQGRYYAITLADMWTDVFAAPGTRTVPDDARMYAIVGPAWRGRLPRGANELRAPTSAGMLRIRLAYRDVADLDAAQAFQRGLQATPLSRWRKKPRPAANRYDVALSRRPPVEQVAGMDARAFFATFAELAGRHAPHANDYPILQRMAWIGLVPGHRFDIARLPPDMRAAIETGVLRGRATVRSRLQPRPLPGDAWRMLDKRRGTYGTDYALRARSARLALVAPLPEDAIELHARTDSDGRPLDGSFRYEVRFERGQLPPADAFWSMTLYNDRQELFDNPLNLYAVGTRHPLTPGADGTVVAYVQYVQPVGELLRNWLPAPQSGRFELLLRMVRPSQDAVESVWTPPTIRRMP